MAMVYDALVVIAILMAAGALGLLVFDHQASALRDPAYTAYLVVVWFAYFGWCWTKGGQTLGMRAWKIRLESATSDRPGWLVCALRFSVALLSAAAAGLGFWWSVFESRNRTWHDLASGTVLVKTGGARPSD